jgi:hypothetical protein
MTKTKKDTDRVGHVVVDTVVNVVSLARRALLDGDGGTRR